MKRVVPIAVVLVLTAATVLLVLLPTSTCPDCGGGWALDGEVDGREVRYPLGCPRCRDAGKIGLFNRWTRPGLHPDLVELLPTSPFGWSEDGRDFQRALERLGARSQLPFDFSRLSQGAGTFVDDGRDRLVAASALIPSGSTGEAVYVVVLFEPGGRALDYAQVSCRLLTAHVLGSWIPSDRFEHEFHVVQGGSGQKTFDVLRPDGRFALPPPSVRIRPRLGRLEILAGEAPK